MKRGKPVVAIKLPPLDLIPKPKETGLAAIRNRDSQTAVKAREGPFKSLNPQRERIDRNLIADRSRRMIPRG